MNTTVTATGMNIEAKSNATYLLISNTYKTADSAPANAAAIQSENSNKGYTTVDLATGDKTALFPVAHGTVGAAPDYTVTEQTAGTGKTTFNWYTMNGTDATATGYVGQAKSARQVADSDIDSYVLSYTLYFTIAKEANDATNLHVSSCTISGDTAVRCLVVGAANSVEFSSTDADGDATVLAESLDDETVVSVTVYVFYDGNADDIYTNNIPDIAPTTVSLEFAVTAA